MHILMIGWPYIMVSP